MTFQILLILLSFALGIVCVRTIASFDIHEREPFATLFLVTLWGGACSFGLAILVYKILALFGISHFYNTRGALLVVGPVEEIAKLLALFSCTFFIRKKMTEPTDGMIYIGCVALGFSLIENYFYARLFPMGGVVLMVRLFLCTPAHISWGVFMGLAYYMLVRYKVGKKILLVALLYAIVMHGIYDSVAFKGWTLLLLILLVRLSYIWVVDLLEFATAISPYRKSLEAFIVSDDKAVREKGLECLNCGSQNPKITHHLEKIRIQKCDQCPCYVVRRDSLFYIFRRFGSKFSHFERDYTSLPSKYSVLFGAVTISEEKKLAFFHLEDLSKVLEDLNAKRKHKFRKEWWFSKSVDDRLNDE